MYYTGVGSRNIPFEIAQSLKEYAILLSNKYTCRTGDAKGSDKIFVDNANPVVAYSPKQVVNDPNHWSYQEVQKYIPNDRSGFNSWTSFVKALLARNMMQVLGPNGNEPSKFLICYAPSLNYEDSSAGGTGYAIRCALAYKIPVYNIFSALEKEKLDTHLSDLIV